MKTISLNRRYTDIAWAIFLYWTVSIAMVFFNKFILTFDPPFDIPITITWLQCVMTTMMSVGIGRQLGLNTKQRMSTLHIHKQMITLSLMFVGMITLNNLTLKYLAVSFYLVGRCLTTVFNVIFSRIILGESTSKPCQIACAVIILGFLVGIQQESSIGSLTFMGLVCGIGSSLCGALYSIFTKKHMHLVDHSPFRLTYFNNLNASFMFLPLIGMMGEIPKLNAIAFRSDGLVQSSENGSRQLNAAGFRSPSMLQFLSSLLISGILGFSISFVSANQIKATSPLTHIVSGTSKAYLQTVIAVLVWKERRTLLWWMSNMCVLGGSMLYAYFRSREIGQNFESTQKSCEDADAKAANNHVKTASV